MICLIIHLPFGLICVRANRLQPMLSDSGPGFFRMMPDYA
jgi:hypothetical protein